MFGAYRGLEVQICDYVEQEKVLTIVATKEILFRKVDKPEDFCPDGDFIEDLYLVS